MLSAATRNGATLKLELTSVGMFSDSEFNLMDIPNVVENSHQDWVESNRLLFEIYEELYLTKGYPDSIISAQYEKLKTNVHLLMKNRLLAYSQTLLSEAISESEGFLHMTDFLAPIRLLRNLDMELQIDLVEIYESLYENTFP
jgi:hypothetical protein